MKTLKNPKAIVILTLFTVIAVFWLTMQGLGRADENVRNWIGASYGIIALIGGLFGLAASKKWGGAKSLLGRAILMLSIGLLLQEFGQLSYAYFVIVKGSEIPYPSIGDVGYFGSVLFYIYGAYLLSKVTSLKTKSSKALAISIVLPLVLLIVSYAVFLRDYEFEGSVSLATLLDFGYPLGQAIYVSFALLAVLLSVKLLGGIMRPRLLLALAALMIQYVSDFNFLYQNLHESWVTAGYGEFFYLMSYVVMAISLIKLSEPLGNGTSASTGAESLGKIEESSNA